MEIQLILAVGLILFLVVALMPLDSFDNKKSELLKGIKVAKPKTRGEKAVQ